MLRLRASAGVLAIVMTLQPALPVLPAAAAPGARGPRGGGAIGQLGPTERSVTLVTGDRVLVGRDGSSLRAVPAKGREHTRFLFRRHAEHSYVFPHDTLPMLASGRLDQRLFDVSGLIAIGYDDGRRADLPLIVRSNKALPPTARAVRKMSTLDVTAVRVGKDSGFWSGVRTDPAARVWLDGVRQPVLDRSVPHIGAPAAWSAGYTGAGVTVAVLDTGVDASHPDLAGRIEEARNFTESPFPGDETGHGTHVAGTIVGSGAASGGTLRGVAPDARLLAGKVCASFGCFDSDILAGMQWAAVDKQAAVVNLSLGGPDFPGLDPLEEAVNRLSASHGTLFVIAAGNRFECSAGDRVASPGSAEAALTVGATDLDDRLADFSCVGPTMEGNSIKPDITAPGVGIVAARAPGTPVGDDDPVGEFYARASGTSMATPHAAGAAALLAQQHPDWRADRLKAALMAAAAPNPALTAYQQGAGRLDVARVVGQPVSTAPPSVSLGLQLWPHGDDQPLVRSLTYRNDGATAIGLALRPEVIGPDGRPAPVGMFTLDKTSVVVPAGGQTVVTVTADTRVAGPDGLYSGRIAATGGGLAVTTPIAVEREVESYDLSLRAIDRKGRPTEAVGEVYLPGDPLPFAGDTTVRLPRGEHDLAAVVLSEIAGGAQEATLLGAHVTLSANTTLTFDARLARPVEVKAPRASARLVAGAVTGFGFRPGYGFAIGILARGSYQDIYSGHIGQSSDRAAFSSYVHGPWAEPGPEGDFAGSPYTYNLSWFEPGRMFDGLVRHPRHAELATVTSAYPSPPGRQGFKGEFARLPGLQDHDMFSISVNLSFALPAVRTEYYTTENVEWMSEVFRSGPEGDEAALGATWRSFDRGPSTERWGTGVLGPALPQPWFHGLWVRQFPETLVFRVPMFSGAMPGHYGDARTETARTTLYRDGVRVADSPEAGYVLYEAPASPAHIRVETEATQRVYQTSTEIRTSWRLRTHSGPKPRGDALPVMAVRFQPDLGDDNAAPGAGLYPIPIRVERQPGAPPAPLVSLAIEVSYDDGGTWRRVVPLRTGSDWLALVRNPARGFVSLRAVAVDAEGNSVDQTIIRAYRVR
jgi:subtilisin family serine protease